LRTDRSKRLWLAVFAVFCAGLFIGLILSGVVSSLSSKGPELTLKEKYVRAIDNAMIAKSRDRYDHLTPIRDNNTELFWKGEGANRSVLMVIFTRFNSSYPIGQTVNTSWGDTWVTVGLEIKGFFRDRVTEGTNLTLRVAQLLGLPPDTKNEFFVEAWVKPLDLFRPSPDNEINDTDAQLTFPAGVNASYVKWFNGNIIYSYYPKNFPWTRLGYTYDWGNSNSDVGLSEFVIKKGSIIEVKSISTVDQYLVNT
jgi:hypothetical protein